MTQVGLTTFGAGEVIFREGDEPGRAFFILAGRVRVTQQHADGEALLAELGVGEVFGEMAVIECRPRSATVTAVERTDLRAFERDEIQELLKTDHELVITLLKKLFERLRVANSRIPAQQQQALASTSGPVEKLTLVARTPLAAAALGADQLAITEFPFNIGRGTDDPFVENHLSIDEPPPWQIARAHLGLLRYGDRIAAVDRGSHTGSLVNGIRIGPLDGAGPVFFDPGEGEIQLGSPESPYCFGVVAS